MRTIKKVRRLIETDPVSPAALVLARLVTALESDALFDIKDLYLLDEKHFNMAIDLMGDWRLDRYYLGKARVFDIALQAQDLQGKH
ncbi:hypothetical protein [Limnohabitans sp.]|jgi:hypothetical protein|uniref:hypothetical protein n=1 Tax=Limnohabitans sp. TaxID=1907725 RepID=UPI0039190894